METQILRKIAAEDLRAGNFATITEDGKVAKYEPLTRGERFANSWRRLFGRLVVSRKIAGVVTQDAQAGRRVYLAVKGRATFSVHEKLVIND